jgi:hypothetical protein
VAEETLHFVGTRAGGRRLIPDPVLPDTNWPFCVIRAEYSPTRVALSL